MKKAKGGLLKDGRTILFGNYIEWGEHCIPTRKQSNFQVNTEIFNINIGEITKAIKELLNRR